MKAFFLGESSGDERRDVEQHLTACEGCRAELARLGLTQTALLALRDEEVPRRIAFVSDKVFEPRWYQRLWASGPQLGFVSALMLACAILFHAVYVPAQMASSSAVQAEVTKAVAAAEQRIEKQHEADMVAVQDAFRYLNKKQSVLATANLRLEERQ